MSTHYEGLSYGLLEAMAAARPIVATSVPGVQEVLAHEETALLVPPRDPVAMAEAIQRLLEDHDLAAHLGKGARATVQQRYRLEEQLEGLTCVYERLCEEYHSS